MNENRHGQKFPILLLFLGVLLGAILFKSKMMYVEGEEHNMKCCGENKGRIRHFGCDESWKDTTTASKDE